MNIKRLILVPSTDRSNLIGIFEEKREHSKLQLTVKSNRKLESAICSIL